MPVELLMVALGDSVERDCGRDVEVAGESDEEAAVTYKSFEQTEDFLTSYRSERSLSCSSIAAWWALIELCVGSGVSAVGRRSSCRGRAKLMSIGRVGENFKLDFGPTTRSRRVDGQVVKTIWDLDIINPRTAELIGRSRSTSLVQTAARRVWPAVVVVSLMRRLQNRVRCRGHQRFLGRPRIWSLGWSGLVCGDLRC